MLHMLPQSKGIFVLNAKILPCAKFCLRTKQRADGDYMCCRKAGDISVLKENNIAMRDNQNERNAIKFIGGIRY